MLVDGIDGEVLYPSLAGAFYKERDSGFQIACFDVYNDWLREYIGANADRLVGVPSVSVWDIEAGVSQLLRAHSDGLVGGPQIWASPPSELPFSSAHYEPLWEAAESLGVPVSLHVNTGPGYGALARSGSGMESYRTRVTLRTLDAADAIFDLIFSGVLHRHPGLRVVLAEHQIGWLPYYLEQWDWLAAGQGVARATRPKLPFDEPPSAFYYRQVFSTVFHDPAGVRHLRESKLSQNNTMWISDFPHANSSWPHSRRIIAERFGALGPEVLRKLLFENAANLHKPLARLSPLVL